MIGVISLLVVYSLKIWCECSLVTRRLDMTGLIGKTLQVIAFEEGTCLRPLNAPTVTELCTSDSNSQYSQYVGPA